MNGQLPLDLSGTVEPLAALRGYHMPDPISWWPLAPGWWLLLILLLGAGGALTWWSINRRARTAAARTARRELTRLRRELAASNDSTGFIRQLSKLLRRYALAVFPRHQVAALTGDDWLLFLDAHGGNGQFHSGPGRQLIAAPYRPSVTGSVERLASLVEDWIEHNRDRQNRPATTRPTRRLARWVFDRNERSRPAVARLADQGKTSDGDWVEHHRGRRT